MKEPKKLTLHFFTCMHGRTDVAEIFLHGLERLRQAYAEDAEMHLSVAYSDADDLVLCRSFEMRTKMPMELKQVQNDLIGAKWNEALNMAMAHGKADYYIKIDDDDVVSTAGFGQMIDMMRHRLPYIGFDHVLFVDGTNGDASLFKYPNPNKVLGAIRAFSWDMLQAHVIKVLCEIKQQVTQEGAHLEPGEQRWLRYNLAGWLHTQGIVQVLGTPEGTLHTRCRMWTNEWSRSLDWDCDTRLAWLGVIATPAPVDLDNEEPCVIDIKSPGQNIWSYAMRSKESKPYDISRISWLGTKEKELLTALQAQKMHAL